MKVVINKVLGDRRDVADMARSTIDMIPGDKEVTTEYMRKMLLCEHSPIRIQSYKIIVTDIPYSTAMHFVRHGIGVEHFVATQRDDRVGGDRSKKSQTAPVRWSFVINNAAIIYVSRKRMCNCAHRDTRAAWHTIVEEICKYEPALKGLCVPECVYRGICPEFKTCKYHNTYEFQKAKAAYYKLNHNIAEGMTYDVAMTFLLAGYEIAIKDLPYRFVVDYTDEDYCIQGYYGTGPRNRAVLQPWEILKITSKYLDGPHWLALERTSGC